jgi:hypothetical protein
MEKVYGIYFDDEAFGGSYDGEVLIGFAETETEAEAYVTKKQAEIPDGKKGMWYYRPICNIKSIKGE